MKSEALKKRIAALRAMTTARGCTEAEALAAAAKAAELMRDHGITEADITIEEKSVRRKSAGHGLRDRLWRGLAWCTNTATLLDEEAGRPVRTFIGRDPGPEIATYLYVVLDRAIDRAVADFKAGEYYRRRRSVKTKRQAVAEFTVAMVVRLRERLFQLFSDSISSVAQDEAQDAVALRFPDAVSVKPRSVERGKITAATISGLIAGEAVPLAHGMNGDTLQALIGGAS